MAHRYKHKTKNMTKKILLIITGGISCYKSLELIRLLQKQNYLVEAILTDSATQYHRLPIERKAEA